MKFLKIKLEGAYLIESNLFEDSRGIFNKTYNFDEFQNEGIEFDFKEVFYNKSKGKSMIAIIK